jgi:HAMP domain-containing protein
VPVYAAAAVVALALTFTLGKGIRSTNDLAQDDAAMMEVLPVAENLEFFKAMDVLDNLDLLESMGSQGNAA